MTWTPERLATLTTMWNEGASASRIARSLGGVTRNAVIGKVHRLGLHTKGIPTYPDAGTPSLEPSAPTPAALEEAAQEQAEAMRRELARAHTLEDLRSVLDGWLKTGALRPHTPFPHLP